MSSLGIANAVVFAREEFGNAVETIDAGGKLADGFEVVDGHRQRTQDRRERTRRLDRPTDLEFARKHAAGNDRVGHRTLAIRLNPF